MNNNKIMNCDNCKYYNWYYDYCNKWKCKVDEREVYSCYEHRKENDKRLIIGIKCLFGHHTEDPYVHIIYDGGEKVNVCLYCRKEFRN